MNRAANAIMKAIADHAAEQQGTDRKVPPRPPAVTEPDSFRIDAGGIGLVVHDWGGSRDATPCSSRTRPAFTAECGHRSRRVSSRPAITCGRSTFGVTATATAPVETDGYSWHGFADDVLAVVGHLRPRR